MQFQLTSKRRLKRVGVNKVNIQRKGSQVLEMWKIPRESEKILAANH